MPIAKVVSRYRRGNSPRDLRYYSTRSVAMRVEEEDDNDDNDGLDHARWFYWWKCVPWMSLSVLLLDCVAVMGSAILGSCVDIRVDVFVTLF